MKLDRTDILALIMTFAIALCVAIATYFSMQQPASWTLEIRW